MYAVKSDETNDVNNLHKAKYFFTNGEILDILQLDSKEQPTVELTGGIFYIADYTSRSYLISKI